MNLVIAGLMFLQLRETVLPERGTPFSLRALFNQYLTVLRSPVYVGYALTGALVTAAYLGFASIMPYIFVDRMGGTSAQYGNWFLPVSLGFFTGSLLASSLTTRLGLDRLIKVGLLLAWLAAALLVGVTAGGYLLAALIFLPMGVLTFRARTGAAQFPVRCGQQPDQHAWFGLRFDGLHAADAGDVSYPKHALAVQAGRGAGVCRHAAAGNAGSAGASFCLAGGSLKALYSQLSHQQCR
ncbi:MAG: hypothetical protein R3E95_10385 [Thiolinea sp.]